MKIKELQTAAQVVEELDNHIVGQSDAKRAMAVALRNRERRMKLPDTLRAEVMPKNLLLVGSTGIGKSELGRRVARITGAPFIKVEATKFTEVGYVGRDVDSVVRQLADAALQLVRNTVRDELAELARKEADEEIIDALLPNTQAHRENHELERKDVQTKLDKGLLDKETVEIALRRGKPSSPVDIQVMTGGGGDHEPPEQIRDMLEDLQSLGAKLFDPGNKAGKKGKPQETQSMKVSEARTSLSQSILDSLIQDRDLDAAALDLAQQRGIVFIDEIDKICRGSGIADSGQVSREGVQRDLLPLLEGTTVRTRIGMLSTQHVLFIAAGAFHNAKPSDLLPELQGRLPVHVKLKSLSAKDLGKIMTDPEYSIIRQYTELLKVDKTELEFTKDGIEEIAQIAQLLNNQRENLGARRLHDLFERILAQPSYDADGTKAKVVVDSEFVKNALGQSAPTSNKSRYLL